jgi:hypothetical protein
MKTVKTITTMFTNLYYGFEAYVNDMLDLFCLENLFEGYDYVDNGFDMGNIAVLNNTIFKYPIKLMQVQYT